MRKIIRKSTDFYFCTQYCDIYVQNAALQFQYKQRKVQLHTLRTQKKIYTTHQEIPAAVPHSLSIAKKYI